MLLLNLKVCFISVIGLVFLLHENNLEITDSDLAFVYPEDEVIFEKLVILAVYGKNMEGKSWF